ncbi:MAG: T9SS type A sorting domain-containing protein, partial [bacterium]
TGPILCRGSAADRSRLQHRAHPLVGDSTTLRFVLPATGPATIKVIDVTGRIVLTRSLAAGRHGSAQLELRDLSAEVYLVRFDTEGFNSTAKLVIER